MNNVDVIIPTFEETENLLRAIESVHKQGALINKIIIIDDGSCEKTIQFLKNSVCGISKVEVIFLNHTGLPGVVRQAGIDKSNSEWIAFLDADDWWADGKIEAQLNSAARNRSSFVCTNAYIFSGLRQQRIFFTDLPGEIKFRELVKTNWIINSSVLIKKELFIKIGGYATSKRVRAVEDYATWLRISTLINVSVVKSALVNYSDGSESIRKGDLQDPRVFAFIDFLFWQKERKNNFSPSRKFKNYLVWRAMKRSLD